MKRIILLAVAFVFFAGVAHAQGGDVAIGYSYLRLGGSGGTNTNGVSGSVSVNTGHIFSLAGDIGFYHASPLGVSINTSTYMFGPRLSVHLPTGPRPFVQALVGGSHISASFGGLTGSSNPFAWSFGGGVDLPISRNGHVALRPQVDYIGLHANGTTLNCTRISVGLAFHI